MNRFAVLFVAMFFILAGCGESLEDRATQAFIDCVSEYGLEGGVVGITRRPDGGLAIIAPDLPEPAGTECMFRMTAVLAE